MIYLQAKRWEGTVGRPGNSKVCRCFQGFRARKGVFITTSGYSKAARDFAENIDVKNALIDGSHLADYMMEHGVGVSTQATYVIQK